MKKFSFLAAAFAVFFYFASCNLLSSDKISETGRAEFSLSPELARAVIDSLQADEGEANPHMTQNLSIEVKLTGEYSAEKSLQIDVTDLNIEQKSEDLKSKIEDKLTSQTIVIDSIPAGKRVSADVKVYLVSSHGDIQMKKDILVKGKSDPVTISAGDNLISVALSIVYRSYPVTFNLSFEKAGGDFTTCRSVDLYAVKADSDTVLKFFSTFAEGQGSSTDFYNILNGHLNPDCFTEAYWYKDSENKDIDQTAVTEDAMTLSGKIYLPFDEKIIVVALANFTGGDDGLYYICHVPGSSMDEVMSHAFVPDAGGNTVELKSNKLAVSTQYALYQTAQIEGQTQYMYFLSSSPSDIGMSVGTSTVNTFCFDEDGFLYYLGDNSDKYVFKSSKSSSFEVETSITYDSFLNNMPSITVDHKKNIMYLANLSGGCDLSLTQYPELISSGTLGEAKNFYHYNNIDNNFLFNKGTPFAVYHDKAYFVVQYNDSTKSDQLYVIDLSKAVFESDVYRISEGQMIDLGLDEIKGNKKLIIYDMIYQNGAIYLLVKEVELSAYDKIYSRGLLLKYDLITKSINKYGWTDSSLSLENTYNYIARPINAQNNPGALWEDGDGNPVLTKADNWFSLYSPSNDKTSFYGPSRFIAIKPKKLVIADDGYSFYTDSLGAWRYKNVNRIVTVDLDTFIFTCTNVGVNFSGDNSTILTYRNSNGSYFDYLSTELQKVYNSQTKEVISGASIYYNTEDSREADSASISTWKVPAIRLDD